MDTGTFLLLVLIGVFAGFLSGIVGIGGGIIIVPGLIYLAGLTPLMAQGTSLMLMLPPIGILAFMQYYKAGNINIYYGLTIATTFIIGGYFGGKFAQKLDQDLIKFIFGILMLVVSVKMVLGGWKYFGSNN
jgi:uncharacterized membrane protein YfcA